VSRGHEACLECQREQEREKDLHARLGYPDLLQDLTIGSVGPLQGRFTSRFSIPLIVIMNCGADLTFSTATLCGQRRRTRLASTTPAAAVAAAAAAASR
jgi:hypothetical protein